MLKENHWRQAGSAQTQEEAKTISAQLQSLLSLA
jgi:hypothetical protein